MEKITDTLMHLLEASTATLALVFGLGVLAFAAYCLWLIDKRGGQDGAEK